MPTRALPPVFELTALLQRLEGVRCITTRIHIEDSRSQPSVHPAGLQRERTRGRRAWQPSGSICSPGPSSPTFRGEMIPLFRELGEATSPSFPRASASVYHSQTRTAQSPARSFSSIARREPAPYSGGENAGFGVRSLLGGPESGVKNKESQTVKEEGRRESLMLRPHATHEPQRQGQGLGIRAHREGGALFHTPVG